MGLLATLVAVSLKVTDNAQEHVLLASVSGDLVDLRTDE